MDLQLFAAVERLESMLVSLREQVADLRELVEHHASAAELELSRMEARHQRLATELGARMLEQRSYWLEVEHTSAPADSRPR